MGVIGFSGVAGSAAASSGVCILTEASSPTSAGPTSEALPPSVATAVGTAEELAIVDDESNGSINTDTGAIVCSPRADDTAWASATRRKLHQHKKHNI